MEDEILHDIAYLLKNELGKKVDNLTLETKLEHDLQLAGVTAEDFMVAFFKHFKIELGDYDFCKYFIPELPGPFYSLSWLIARIFGNKLPYGPPAYDLNIGDLVKSVEAGIWIDPLQNNDKNTIE